MAVLSTLLSMVLEMVKSYDINSTLEIDPREITCGFCANMLFKVEERISVTINGSFERCFIKVL
jgi:hypothetical protein